MWLFFFLSGCENPDTDTNTEIDAGTETGTHTDTAIDTDTDAGTETGIPADIGGNCGGPEPPPDSLWECDGAGSGPPWPAFGGPEDLVACLTETGDSYWMSPDGLSVDIVRDADGQPFQCLWNGESYVE